jgi:hypothetical protein
MADTSNKPTDDRELEGPRSFTAFINALADGEAEGELSFQLHELAKRMQQEAKARGDKVSGSLSLNIKMVVDTSGHAIVGYDVSTKQPKRKTSGAVFWLTEGGNLSADNPRQAKLPLREVKGGREPARDITEPKSAREV